MIYPPAAGGSGAPTYTRHLLEGMAKYESRPGVLFSTSERYVGDVDSRYESFPVVFAQAPIFDSQPKITRSIPFRRMTSMQVDHYLKKMRGGLGRAIANHHYDLIHVQHGMYLGYLAALVREELGIPYVVTLHVMELNFLEEFPDPILAMAGMAYADRIIALTAAQKTRLLETYTRENTVELECLRSGDDHGTVQRRYEEAVGGRSIDPERLVICPLGIDTDLFNVASIGVVPGDLAALSVAETDRVVLFAGRLLEMKGVEHLIRAEPVYNSARGVHTIILGGGELEDFVARKSRQIPMLHYLGYKENSLMPTYYNFAAENGGLFCVPSASEGMSLSYLEAMACGLGVVACCRRDMGDLDFMQPPYVSFATFGDVENLASKISRMLDDNRHWSAPEIRERVRRLDVHAMVEAVREVYESVLHERR